jgi:histidinol dehydrogenase
MLNPYIWNNLTELEKENLLARPKQLITEAKQNKVKEILAQVQSRGDAALFALEEKYDQAKLKTLLVSKQEIRAAFNKISKKSLQAITFAKQQIERYNQKVYPKQQKFQTTQGVYCARQPRPIDRVGLYVPGGTAPLLTTALMLAVPAQIAKCPLRILCSPPQKDGSIDPHILVAASLCDIKLIYKLGGAQAIAAMAYGTESVAKVDKIFGPGNSWVTQAKMQVAQASVASIDMPAGPSELMVIADDAANADWVAADLLSQAEHGLDSQVSLLTLSQTMAEYVQAAIQTLLPKLPRREIILTALKNTRVIIVESINQAIAISNQYAPEHLILQITRPNTYLKSITNAGAVFVGKWSAETLGDYVTGSNHVLPTAGFAKSYSGLSVLDFIKFIHVETITRTGLKNIGTYAETLANLEGLNAHQLAITLRLKAIEGPP